MVMQLFPLKVEGRSVAMVWTTISTACCIRSCFRTKSSLAIIAHAAPSDVGLNLEKKHFIRKWLVQWQNKRNTDKKMKKAIQESLILVPMLFYLCSNAILFHSNSVPMLFNSILPSLFKCYSITFYPCSNAILFYSSISVPILFYSILSLLQCYLIPFYLCSNATLFHSSIPVPMLFYYILPSLFQFYSIVLVYGYPENQCSCLWWTLQGP